ncbi:hypothetical protein [Scytonema sp. NUACC21]
MSCNINSLIVETPHGASLPVLNLHTATRTSMQQASHPTVILGGGFAGLFTALHLSHQNYSHPIILIEQRDRFSFKPLLYELLSGELHSDQVYPRYKDLLAGSRVTFVQDTVKVIS